MRSRWILAATLMLFLGGLILLVACGPSGVETTVATPGGASATPVPGEKLLQERCTRCHTLDRVQSAHKTQAEWETTVQRMVGKGAQLSDAEFATLVQYLAATYK